MIIKHINKISIDQTREKKYPYVPPLVVQTVGVQLEREFLVGSMPVEPLVMETASQEVDNIDFSDNSFNFVWD